MPVFFEKAIIGNSSGCFQPQKRKLKIFLKKKQKQEMENLEESQHEKIKMCPRK